MIQRPDASERIKAAFQMHPIAALLGPRQCGKTTLAHMISEQYDWTYFDLENPIDLQRLSAPMITLEKLTGLVVIDEIQRKPELLEILRVLVDRPKNPVQFLILGSASPDLVKGASESLAGRIGFIDLSGFSLREIGMENRDRLWLRGGFPRSYLAKTESMSMDWRNNFVRTFLERDIPQLGISVPAEALRRFWTMIAHYHGQVWNAAQFARSLGTSEKTARRYLDILSGSYMVRILPPWHENIRKRQVKAPKIYIRDSGILHALLQLKTMMDLQAHPKLGASWEGFCLEQIVEWLGTRDVYFWATYVGAEIDMMALIAGKRYGFEFKYADAPGATRSMRIAIEDLELERLWIIYPGQKPYDIERNISVIPLTQIQNIDLSLKS